MKKPLNRARSTDSMEAVLGLALVILANVFFFYQDSVWHFIKSRWPIHDVTEVTIGSILTMCVFVGIIKAGFLKNVASPIVVGFCGIGFFASLIVTVICVVFLADKFRPLEILVGSVCAILGLCFLGLIVRVVGLLLWLFMCYLVDHYREGGDKREEWREHNRAWRVSYRKMRPFPKFFFDTLGWALWGAVGLGILWGIRACSKAIIEPDDHPPAYYDPNP